MILYKQINRVLSDNELLRKQFEGFKELNEQLLKENSELQKLLSEMAEKRITDILQETILQGQMQTDIELTQIEHEQRILELEAANRGDKNV